jgi:hypothetical protein
MRPSFVLVAMSLLACAPSSRGAVRLFVSGELAAETGYPTPGPDPIAFVDGWSMDFDHVLVGVETIRLGQGELARPPLVADLHLGPAELFTEAALPSGRLEVGYTLAVPGPSSVEVGVVDPAVRARMESAGASLLLAGRARHPVHGAYTFELAVSRPIIAESCEQADGTLGLVVPDNGATEAELTVHLDHLFFDSGTAEAPSLRFEAWAAAAGDDRHVTLDELAAQPLADLVGIDGMPLRDEDGLVAYVPPATGASITTLREHVLALAASSPHWMGEGHCRYR